MKTKIFIIAAGLLAVSAIAGNVALAIQIPGISQVGPTSVTGTVDVIKNIVKWVYILFFIIAVLFIILAAFNYLTAQGHRH